jgi:hypothetical protein
MKSLTKTATLRPDPGHKKRTEIRKPRGGWRRLSLQKDVTIASAEAKGEKRSNITKNQQFIAICKALVRANAYIMLSVFTGHSQPLWTTCIRKSPPTEQNPKGLAPFFLPQCPENAKIRARAGSIRGARLLTADMT